MLMEVSGNRSMKTYPMVSLILTSYNCKENIGHTLRSIEEQDYPHIEVIVVDGGSADGTVEIIKNYAEKTRFGCKWISQKDEGIYDAMNKGYKLSNGDIIAFFNDLFLKDNVVSLMVDAIVNENADGAHADLVYAVGDRIKRYWHMGDGDIRQGWMPGHPTLYLKREVYEKYGLYDISYKCAADYEFMVRILKDDEIKLVYVPVVIIKMFYGGTSNQGLSNYLVSLREGHRALVSNGVRRAMWIDFQRTFRVYMQFVKAHMYK